jgi:hypothetical protein
MIRTFLIACTALAGAVAANAQGYYDRGYGYDNYGNYSSGSRLSKCTRNALIGAGVGAVAGAVLSREGKRSGNAVLGAALGGGGAWLACRYLGNRDRGYVENGYYDALNAGAPIALSFANSMLGGTSYLNVAQPQPVYGRPDCFDVSASLTNPGYGAAPLPQERYCRVNNQWAPLDY